MSRLFQLCLFIICCLGTQAEIVVVIAADSPISRLSRAQLVEVFSGRTRMVNGVTITPIEYINANRDQFYQHVLGRTSNQMRAAWAKLLFTGEGQPPREFSSLGEARSQVISAPGLITYIDAQQVGPGLKVVYQ
ncbi:hypothetical protein [Chitinimonas sp. BJB300]|uniref:hypothetical protein n=1 Tax=Chitinimonas sp. BJB300 TaxID=1559339 RepID=UPI000C0FD858|nr:hypothetical protein [Chitinimonas sp. BJB300]PHV11358.1 hypothetical protein CSQ89_11345 [Chitinimonas sp. BJB300]TSJ87469.1 hypothetical protein FG002_013085 [Chitinimonas sp. BJB300]